MIIKISDYFKYPIGQSDGIKFKNEVLIPAIKQTLQNNDELVIILGQQESYTASFLEAAFGGLEDNFKYSIKIDSYISRYKDAIERYINK